MWHRSSGWLLLCVCVSWCVAGSARGSSDGDGARDDRECSSSSSSSNNNATLVCTAGYGCFELGLGPRSGELVLPVFSGRADAPPRELTVRLLPPDGAARPDMVATSRDAHAADGGGRDEDKAEDDAARSPLAEANVRAAIDATCAAEGLAPEHCVQLREYVFGVLGTIEPSSLVAPPPRGDGGDDEDDDRTTRACDMRGLADDAGEPFHLDDEPLCRARREDDAAAEANLEDDEADDDGGAPPVQFFVTSWSWRSAHARRAAQCRSVWSARMHAALMRDRRRTAQLGAAAAVFLDFETACELNWPSFADPAARNWERGAHNRCYRPSLGEDELVWLVARLRRAGLRPNARLVVFDMHAEVSRDDVSHHELVS